MKPTIPLIVLTGGPGAGKTAVLEIVRRMVCPHVAVLPESAGILFGGGFWRLNTTNAKMAAQRAIFHVQRELEALTAGEELFKAAICDRGTLDGLAYWPAPEEDYFSQLNLDREQELKRYHSVIHLRTPEPTSYNHSNPLRVETPEQAMSIDQKIERAWSGHPRRMFVESQTDFMDKAQMALSLILRHLPSCSCGKSAM